MNFTTELSLVVVLDAENIGPGTLLAPRGVQGDSVELIVVDVSSESREGASSAMKTLADNATKYVRMPGVTFDEALQAGLSLATMAWIVFDHAGQSFRTPVAKEIYPLFKEYADQPPSILICYHRTATHSHDPADQLTSADTLDLNLQECPAIFFRRNLLTRQIVAAVDCARPGFEISALASAVLLDTRDQLVRVIDCKSYAAPGPKTANEPAEAYWKKPDTYQSHLRNAHLAPLEVACQNGQHAPRWLQRTVLMELQQYFTKDMAERSPTVIVSESIANEFHDILRLIMSHIDVDAIDSLPKESVSVELKHALLSYKGRNCHSPVSVDAYDHDQDLVRLSYFIHGEKPVEEFSIGGQIVQPAYAKYRACRFFRSCLMRERIVWLKVDRASEFHVMLNATQCGITLREKSFLSNSGQSFASPGISPNQIRATFPRGKEAQQPLPKNVSGLKALLLRWLARALPIRRTYRDAWVLADRATDADDNAEHLYRWLSIAHPEISTWFLLDRSSTDWKRLESDGFRLVSNGLKRKLLLLNCKHLISSHAEFEFGGFDLRYYGDMMEWRFTFVPHGISKDDVSHWLSKRAFDLFITTSPAEYESIVADDTPYTYTKKEMRLTGFPRQDRLLSLAAQTRPNEVDKVLIMPTWRGSLVDDRVKFENESDILSHFANSNYAQCWRALLHDKTLEELAAKHGKKLCFMPHPNAVPYLEAFSPPPHVLVVTKADVRFLALLSKTLALITDYTSVAFEMANLRRQTFYYQFDREAFYGGDHNWREGYFNYDRDGFGPVSTDQIQLVDQVRVFLERQGKPEHKYLQRMETALPLVDGRACERVFESIVALSGCHR